jgi:hypothetical protein
MHKSRVSHGRTTQLEISRSNSILNHDNTPHKRNIESKNSVSSNRNNGRKSLQPANSTSKLLRKESGGDIGHVLESAQEGSRMRAILKKLEKEEV